MGNKRLRSLVDPQKINFQNAKKRSEKREIARKIVAATEARGGRFLTEDPELIDKQGGKSRLGRTGGAERKASVVAAASNLPDDEHVVNAEDNGYVEDPGILCKVWVRVDHEKAMSKVMHRLRDKIVDEGTPGAIAMDNEEADATPSPDTEALSQAGSGSSRAGGDGNVSSSNSLTTKGTETSSDPGTGISPTSVGVVERKVASGSREMSNLAAARKKHVAASSKRSREGSMTDSGGDVCINNTAPMQDANAPSNDQGRTPCSNSNQ